MPVRWALEEVGQPYDVRLVSFAEMKEPAHRALQPFGQIPTYQFGDLVLFESGAIVLDIATLRKKGDKLSHSTFANSELLINLVNGGLNLSALEQTKARKAGVVGDSLGIAGDLLSSIVYMPAKIVGAR